MATNNPTRPTEVHINEKNVQSLVNLFEQAYGEIVKDILSQPDYSSARRISLLNQIDARLAKLGVDTSAKLGEYMPELYESGMSDAVAQLREIRARVVDDGFSLIHQDAILALIDDTQRSFAESMTGFKRGVQRLLTQAVKDQISQNLALGTLRGDSLRKIKQNLVGIIETDGIPALIDRSGRSWSLDRYAEMLIRTKFVEARNRGLANRVAENGYDLVQVPSHGSKHYECRIWEGKMLSINGLTPGFPTVMDAQVAGLFHPNCQHAINVIDPELAAQTEYYDAATKSYKKGVEDPEIRKALGLPALSDTNSAPLVTIPKSITLTAGKNSATFELNEQEAELLDRGMVEFAVDNKKSALGYFQATYSRSTLKASYAIKINLNSLAKQNLGIEKTVYHEIGHAIDSLRFNPNDPRSLITTGSDSEKFKAFKEAYIAERKAIVLERMKESWKNKYSDDILLKLLQGEEARVPTSDGKEVGISLTRSRVKYLNSPSEVFADAYAQFRTQPEKMKEYAPKMYKFYEEIFL